MLCLHCIAIDAKYRYGVFQSGSAVLNPRNVVQFNFCILMTIAARQRGSVKNTATISDGLFLSGKF